MALTGGPILLAIGKGNTPIPFEKGADGVWTLTVGPLKPNMYIYRLVVDGVAVVDPNNTVTGFSDQPGYSTVVVHGDGPAYYDAKPVPHGNVTRHVYHSTVLNGEREMYVYTPPNYDRNRKYPVLYLLGGSGELASNWNIDGRAGFIADNLIAEGKALPMIIAMPNNQVVHRGDPKHTELTFPLFEKELRQHIIPVVDKAYSTQAGSARPRDRRPLDGRPARAARRLQGARPVPLVRHHERRRSGVGEEHAGVPQRSRDQSEGGLPVRRPRDASKTSRPIAAWSSTRFSRSTASSTTTTSAATAGTTGAPGARTWSTCCRNCGGRSRRRDSRVSAIGGSGAGAARTIRRRRPAGRPPGSAPQRPTAEVGQAVPQPPTGRRGQDSRVSAIGPIGIDLSHR